MLYPFRPIISHTHPFHYHNTSPASYSIFTFPPLLNLLGRCSFCFRLTIGKSTGSFLSTNNDNYILTKPCLKVGDHIATVACQVLLQVDYFRVQMSENVNVSG